MPHQRENRVISRCLYVSALVRGRKWERLNGPHKVSNQNRLKVTQLGFEIVSDPIYCKWVILAAAQPL